MEWFVVVIMIHKLRMGFSDVYLMQLSVAYFLVKGFSGILLELVLLPYFQLVHHVDLITFQKIVSVVLDAPWCFKPMIAVLSDVFPIYQYRKRPYIIISCLIAIVLAVIIATADLALHTSIGCFVLMALCFVTIGLLHDASYSTQMTRVLVHGNLIVNYVWLLVMGGGLIASIVVGIMADMNYTSVIIPIVIPPFLLLIYTTYKNYLEERPYNIQYAPSRDSIIVAVIISLSAVLSSILIFYMSEFYYLCVIIILSILNITAMHIYLKPHLLHCVMFMLLSEASRIVFIGASTFFYTAFCIGTPNLDYAIFITYSKTLSCIFGIVGICIFHYICEWRIQSIFIFVNAIAIVSSCMEIIQTARWNLIIGIPDVWFFILGESVTAPIVRFMMYIGMFILMSRMVSNGSEAIELSILTAAQMFGRIIATAIGNYIITAYAIEDCDFSLLPYALFLGKMVIPLVIIPIATIYLPDGQLHRLR